MKKLILTALTIGIATALQPAAHAQFGSGIVYDPTQSAHAVVQIEHEEQSIHPDLLNSRFGYVSISRASHEATLFTDDLARLGPQLAADVSKTSALEISQPSSIAQGIGLGL